MQQQHIPIQTITQPTGLVDRFARQYHYLRLSITDVCNFRCNYCLPNGYQIPADRPHFLRLDEIQRLGQAFADLGCQKIRLTGGEPTLRKDFLAIAQSLAQIEGINKLALTTNGYRMERDVSAWQAVGISDINVSVDSLDPRQFQQITGENRLASILRGIEKAFAVGYTKIKVNAVLMRDYTPKEFSHFLAWVKDSPVQMRFIELMQTGEMDSFFAKQHFSGQKIQQQLLDTGWTLKSKQLTDGPAKVLAHPDYVGEIGLIMPYDKQFCASCNRLRVSATGKLHLCLFGEEGVELRDLLQQDSDLLALKLRLQSSLQQKREHHYLHLGDSGVRNHLASIGG